MLQLFVAGLTLTNEFSLFDSVDDVAFAAPPVFGSYDLQEQADLKPEPLPLINLEETCFSSNLQDDPEVAYQIPEFSEEVLSCSEAFEMHQSMYSGNVCSFAYPLNGEEDTLLDRCGKTFCSECTQVENDNEEFIYAKEVYDDIGYALAPGFAISPSEGKHSVQGLAAPIPVEDIGMAAPMKDLDDASLPSLVMPQDVDPVDVPQAMYAPIDAEVGNDTPIEVSLEAPMMHTETSMVPPGLASGNSWPKQRMNRYQSHTSEL